MPGETIKTRFAPSPSGDLHLGNVRTALFSWLLARRHGGTFIVRIEDTDATRSTEAAVTGIVEDLRWLHLEWDEGPGREGESGPCRQSARGPIYERMFATLAERGRTYPCFCSPELLAVQRKTQLAAGRPPRYTGTCATLTGTERRERLDRGLVSTLRFRVPPGRVVRFADAVRGPQSFRSDDIGDFIVRRADGSAAFFFCNAVDDALMGVTDVLRGEDHLTNTPRQLLLLEALDLPAPRYGHVSLIVGRDGAPLSKRQGSVSLRELRGRGFLAAAVTNCLARLGHWYESGDLLELPELAESFDVARLGSAPACFDDHQLAHWQREAVSRATSVEIAGWFGTDVKALVPDSDRDAFIEAVRGNVLFPHEAAVWAQILYGETMTCDEPSAAVLRDSGPDLLRFAVAALDEHPDDYLEFVEHLKAASPARGKALFQPLRAALTGRLDGPDLASLFPLLGANRIRRRLEKYAC